MSELTPSILVVDDEADIRAGVGLVLRRAGFDVLDAADGRSAIKTFFDARPDLVILDIQLPDIDGWTVLERIRELSSVLVLMLTAFADEQHKVRGLREGADDYLAKPFGNAELVARVQALLRRRPSADPVAVFDDGILHLDLASHRVTVGDEEKSLTPTDWNLLVALVRHAGQVLSPEQLLELAWKDPLGVGPERVKYAVLRLRRHLGWEDPDSSPIQAVRGFGYRYRPHS